MEQDAVSTVPFRVTHLEYVAGITGLRAAGDLFALRLRTRRFFIISRRAFASVEDADCFRELAKRHIGQTHQAAE
jgi:hypothetical protein